MKIGIVGGYGHECIKFLPGAELAWACDGYDLQALERARAFGCERTYLSMEEMLADFRPDIVYTGTFYAGNGRLAIQALELGFDVVSEKPLAASREDLLRLSELTKSGERRAIAEFAMRWNTAFKRVRDLIHDGAIGSVVMIHAQKSYQFGASRPDFYKSRKLFGGIIPWVAVHAIDYASWCTGLRYKSVVAIQGNRCFPAYPEMEDHSAMLFTMTGGIPCTITADFLRPEGAASHGDDRLRVTGSDGVLEIRNSDVYLANRQGEQHWKLETPDASAIQRASDLAEAACGISTSEISTSECLHVTGAAIAARYAADAGRTEQIG
jgi:predicted dehydrogenase